MFIDKQKRFVIVEDFTKFLKVMKDLKHYMVEFEKDGSMKTKLYPDYYILKS